MTYNNGSTYNGYSNYMTWLVCLWLDQDDYASIVEEHHTEPIDAEDLGNEIRDMLEELQPEVVGLFADIINGALDSVDWEEVGEHFMPESFDMDTDEAWEAGNEIATDIAEDIIAEHGHEMTDDELVNEILECEQNARQMASFVNGICYDMNKARNMEEAWQSYEEGVYAGAVDTVENVKNDILYAEGLKATSARMDRDEEREFNEQMDAEHGIHEMDREALAESKEWAERWADYAKFMRELQASIKIVECDEDTVDDQGY